MKSAHAVAQAVRGDVVGRNAVMCPGPGHSRKDRSLSIKLDAHAPDGFIVNSFAGDDPLECRDFVRALIGLGEWHSTRKRKENIEAVFHTPETETTRPENIDPDPVAMRIWAASSDPRGSIAEQYLIARGLELPDDIAGDVLRFHPRLSLGDGKFAPAMIALFRDIVTDQPKAIHRTFLNANGSKLGRKMLGPVRDAAIKLDCNADVTMGLHVGEGVETCLAARLAGFKPVWALGSAGAIASFPVLSGIDGLTVLGERNDNGANDRAMKACAARWNAASRDVLSIMPKIGDDFCDAWRGTAA